MQPPSLAGFVALLPAADGARSLIGPAIAFLAGLGGWTAASLAAPRSSGWPVLLAANDNERFVTRPYLP